MVDDAVSVPVVAAEDDDGVVPADAVDVAHTLRAFVHDALDVLLGKGLVPNSSGG